MDTNPRSITVQDFPNGAEATVAILVDCDNVPPEILPYALRVAAQFGRVALRRGYGNHATLANRWQDALVRQAFTPHLQYQYASGKNTADIALALDALEAMFDHRADTFCLVTSDSDFAYLCRKLRERGSRVCIVGEAKTPQALRNASDQFFEWSVSESDPDGTTDSAEKASAKKEPTTKPKAKKAEQNKEAAKDSPKDAAKESSKQPVKQRPRFVVEAVSLLTSESSEGKVGLSALGQYLKRTDPAFSPKTFGHSGLLDMVKTYDLLELKQEQGAGWYVALADQNGS